MTAPPNIRRVKLLPDELINRIAAGEVVERPAAVLKELLENSLDAGADRLEIEIEGGGQRLIRLRDNGRGMDEDDLLMCLERHATSKLDQDDDLLAIATLGFRGEALPSIGAVSRLTITSAVDSGQGHVVTLAGGRLEGLKEAPANRGTTVEVGRLFYNVPARRKFLKSTVTESAHLLDVARTYALSRPDLRLTYRDGGREMMSVESRHDFRTRVYRVLGQAIAESLQPFDHQEGQVKISGWLSGPEVSLRSTANVFIYVLGRPVKDRLLNRALADGYGRILPPGQWPAAVLFLDLDPAEVDVNVHPAKTEVRFRQPGAVFSALSAAVSRAVGRGPAAVSRQRPVFDFQPAPAPVLAAPAAPPPWLAPESDPEATAELAEPAEPAEPELETAEPTAAISTLRAAPAGELDSAAEGRHFEPLRPLAQLYQSYILAEGERGLYLIDQHAAHERLIFNQLKATLAAGGLLGQARLFPETMDLPPLSALAAEKMRPRLEQLGFDLEPFGERTFILKSAPAILGQEDPWPPLLEILGSVEGRLKSADGAGLGEALEALVGSWLYSLACRAAIKAGEKMTLPAMARLLDDMAVTDKGAYCPHGRPAIQLIERRIIEKRFDR